GRRLCADIEASPHPLKITVSCGGRELEAARRILPANADGKYHYEYVSALNDPEGTYCIRVDDLLSDRTASAELNMKFQ
ncbi:MAG: hypothetical protein IKO93_24815, partial [Lentisphaeria bacterium]|nr:hypothetical protein [Lentisphaeria bacterium]